MGSEDAQTLQDMFTVSSKGFRVKYSNWWNIFDLRQALKSDELIYNIRFIDNKVVQHVSNCVG